MGTHVMFFYQQYHFISWGKYVTGKNVWHWTAEWTAVTSHTKIYKDFEYEMFKQSLDNLPDVATNLSAVNPFQSCVGGLDIITHKFALV